MKKKQPCSLPEPIYDDVTLDFIKQQEVEELVDALAQYCIHLEKKVIKLRSWINSLTPPSEIQPFFDLHSDIYEVFHHYAVYAQFKQQLKDLD